MDLVVVPQRQRVVRHLRDLRAAAAAAVALVTNAS